MKTPNKIIPSKFRYFEHPKINIQLKKSVLKQLSTNISLYDNSGIYKEVEDKLAQIFPSKHILTVCNGTSALYTMYFAAGIRSGDEVLVPVYTFFATAMPLFQIGAVPILIDCRDDGNIDPKKIEEKISNNTKGVVITHMWGIPCDLKEISEICKKNNLLLMEDCSHAHGATYLNERVGTIYSDIAAWSLQGKKLLTSGEGGFIATNNQIFFEKAVLLGHFNKRAKKEVFSDDLKRYTTTGLGANLRMHPLGAAILRPQLSEFDKHLKERREVAKLLSKEVLKLDGLTPLPYSDLKDPAWYAFPIIFDSNKFTVSMDEFVRIVVSLGAEEVDIPGSTCPLNRFNIFKTPWEIFPEYEKFKDRLKLNGQEFVNADKFHSTMFKFPTWYGQERKKFAKYYLEALKFAHNKYKK